MLAGYLVDRAVGAGRAVAALALADATGRGALASSPLVKLHDRTGELGGIVTQRVVVAHYIGFHELKVGDTGGTFVELDGGNTPLGLDLFFAGEVGVVDNIVEEAGADMAVQGAHVLDHAVAIGLAGLSGDVADVDLDGGAVVLDRPRYVFHEERRHDAGEERAGAEHDNLGVDNLGNSLRVGGGVGRFHENALEGHGRARDDRFALHNLAIL